MDRGSYVTDMGDALPFVDLGTWKGAAVGAAVMASMAGHTCIVGAARGGGGGGGGQWRGQVLREEHVRRGEWRVGVRWSITVVLL